MEGSVVVTESKARSFAMLEPMYELIQYVLVNDKVVLWAYDLNLTDCLKEAARANYLADGMAVFSCEISI